jgi:hypothetical protein
MNFFSLEYDSSVLLLKSGGFLPIPIALRSDTILMGTFSFLNIAFVGFYFSLSLRDYILIDLLILYLVLGESCLGLNP